MNEKNLRDVTAKIGKKNLEVGQKNRDVAVENLKHEFELEADNYKVTCFRLFLLFTTNGLYYVV